MPGMLHCTVNVAASASQGRIGLPLVRPDLRPRSDHAPYDGDEAPGIALVDHFDKSQLGVWFVNSEKPSWPNVSSTAVFTMVDDRFVNLDHLAEPSETHGCGQQLPGTNVPEVLVPLHHRHRRQIQHLHHRCVAYAV